MRNQDLMELNKDNSWAARLQSKGIDVGLQNKLKPKGVIERRKIVRRPQVAARNVSLAQRRAVLGA